MTFDEITMDMTIADAVKAVAECEGVSEIKFVGRNGGDIPLYVVSITVGFPRTQAVLDLLDCIDDDEDGDGEGLPQ